MAEALDGSWLWSKGCTKVPALVRESLGIDEGSEIEWTLNDNDEVFAGKV
jgi:bifunctional DNA-binding transcriptional regulator/antitoxin component of YhaV-PrlF toxin-antitoxin module